MRRILLICCLILGISLNAQEEIIPEIFPAAPTASELGKYGSYPVDLSTGLPNIEIPLYTIIAGDIQIPLKLKYHASGIKVNQLPSWVGLGWSLDTGGLISLETRDTPDELEPNPYDIPNRTEIQNIVNTEPYNFQHPTIVDIQNNSWVKDAYHINLPTVSGTFFLDSDSAGEVSTKFPPEEYQVFRNGKTGVLDHYFYKVVDKKGMQYFFKDEEHSQLNKTTNNGDIHIYNTKYTSAWLLSEIVDTKGNSITYTYGTKYSTTLFSKSQSQTYSISETYSNGVTTNEKTLSPVRDAQTSSMTFANKLQAINFPNGRVRFITASDPAYEGPSVYLEKIIIESGNSNIGFTPIKTIVLDYSVIGQPNYYSSTNSYKYRYKLDKVTDTFTLGDEIEIASFEYSSIELPNLRSTAIDFSGFYNNNSGGLIHKRSLNIGGQIKEIGDADRSIDPNKMKAGILTKIFYPTKGYAEFSYEPNSFYGKDIFQLNEVANVNESLNIIGKGDGSQNPYYIFCPDPDDCDIQSKTINFQLEASTTMNISGSIVCNDCNVTNSKYAYAKIYVRNNGVETLVFNGYSNNINETVYLDPGNNYVTLEVYGDRVQAFTQYSYVKNLGNLPDENVQAFGLRIKNITNYDENSKFLNQKEYLYTIPFTNQSSGVVVNKDLKYDWVSDFKSFNFTSCLPTVYNETSTYVYSSSSKAGFENNSIAYEYVTELEKDILGNAKGKTTSQFTVPPNDIFDINTGSIWVNLGYKRGKLLKKEIYDNQEKLLSLEENFYSENATKFNLREDFKVFFNASSNLSRYPGCAVPAITLDMSLYLMNSTTKINWNKKDKSVLTKYYYDGVNSSELKITTDYFYNEQNQEISKTATINSEGKSLSQEYKFAHDLPDTRLISENRISIPLEFGIIENNQIIKNQKTAFKDFDGLYLPELSYSSKGRVVDVNNNFDKKLIYHRYDNSGNPLELSREDGPKIVYIWGYNDQHPIAKIENATYQEVANALSIDISTLDNYNESNLGSMDSLRTNGNLPKALITTYTYKPLIGVTSITDPKGQITTFEYDYFNRLEFVRDNQGKLIKENKYNYKN